LHPQIPNGLPLAVRRLDEPVILRHAFNLGNAFAWLLSGFLLRLVGDAVMGRMLVD